MLRSSTLRLASALTLTLSQFVQPRSTVTAATCTSPGGAALPAVAVVDTNSHNVYENLTAEEALIRGVVLRKGQYLLLFYRNTPCVVVGRNQNIFEEVSLRRAWADAVPIARRSSGGGTVYHDEGNLNLSFFTHRDEYAPEKTIQVLRLGLCRLLGVQPERLTTTKRYDLFLDGKKLTGSAMRVQRDVAFHHCTLLINSARNRVGRYLHSEGEYSAFKAPSVASVRSTVTTLQESGLLSSLGLATDTNADAVRVVQEGLSDFFLSYGSAVLSHEAPWEMRLDQLIKGHDAAPPSSQGTTKSTSHTSTGRYRLDVLQATLPDGYDFIYGEGRRPGPDECTTFAAEVARVGSRDWLFAMPAFTSEVRVSRSELQACMAQHAMWTDLVLLSGLQEDQLAAELTGLILSCEDDSVSTSDASLVLRTTVHQRRVQTLEALVSYGEASTMPLEWLQVYLSDLLTGTFCDEGLQGVERTGKGVTAQVDAFRTAAAHSARGGVDVSLEAEEACLLLLLRAVLQCWRRKNVFDFAVCH